VIAGIDDDGGSPAHASRPLFLPDDLARCGAERGDERADRSAVVLEDEEAVLVEDWRAGAAVVVVEVAELLVPHQLAREIERREAVRSEGGIMRRPSVTGVADAWLFL